MSCTPYGSPLRCYLPAALVLLWPAGCSSPQLAEVEPGRGLIAFDPQPPPGAATHARPTWRAGDRYVFERGGAVRVTVQVREAGPDGYVLEDAGSETSQRRDLDLGKVEEFATRDGTLLRRHAPRDQRFHWPLWIGKRWRCSFVDQTLGGDTMPLEVDYVVEDLDTVTVPAGTFQTLRIARTARIAGASGYYAKCSLSWYAPDLGFEVRQLNDGLLTELVEWTRVSGAPPQ